MYNLSSNHENLNRILEDVNIALNLNDIKVLDDKFYKRLEITVLGIEAKLDSYKQELDDCKIEIIGLEIQNEILADSLNINVAVEKPKGE